MGTDQHRIFAGVDTHKDTHHAAVLDELGWLLADRRFPATGLGYRQLSARLRRHGDVALVGVEGTGSCGAGLAAHLARERIAVVEVNRPDLRTRHSRGKSDPSTPNPPPRRPVGAGHRSPQGPHHRRGGDPGAARGPRRRRQGPHRRAEPVEGPDHHRAGGTARRAARHAPACRRHCARLRPDLDALHHPLQATRAAPKAVAGRIAALDEEIALADRRLAAQVARAAPRTTALPGVSTGHAGQLLVTAGANPHRLGSEAAFAALCAASPIPPSSGKTNRHRINPGGDRAANRALHLIAVVRLRWHEPTRTYVAGAPPKACPSARSPAASSATSPARSTTP